MEKIHNYIDLDSGGYKMAGIKILAQKKKLKLKSIVLLKILRDQMKGEEKVFR